MKPAPWKPSVELSPRETRLLKVIKQKTLYGFLRKHRHELFDDGFQAEMAEMYTDVPGNPPTSPALLAMVTLLQAYTGLSDHDAVVASQTRQPDARWFGAAPQLLVEHRGAAAQAMIEHIEAAVARYPWGMTYRLWPGPNSNTFVAYVARQVPELGLDLPPTAIGKDYLGPTTFFANAPSGTGWQVSLLGLAGVTVAHEEGLEINLLGLGFGVDVNDARLRLPGFGTWPGNGR